MASTRGVQQEEVWAAADALLAEQLRPTIERVRTKLGRGSPNTVAPMLEAWFAALGRRLGVVPAPDGQEGIPAAVTQAAETLWLAACAAADKQAREALATEVQVLDRKRSEVNEIQASLEQRESALAQTLELAQAQIQEQARRLTTLQGELATERQELQACRESLARAVQERDADRRRFDEDIRAQAGERERLQERWAIAEKRLLGEVDRARQEAKQSAGALNEAAHKHRTAAAADQERLAGQAAHLHSALVEVASLQERLQMSEKQAGQLQALLAQERITAAATLEALTRISGQAAPRSRKTRTQKIAVAPT
jgi:chromosome segregation ATPase